MRIFLTIAIAFILLVVSNACKNSAVKNDTKLESLKKYSTIISDTTFSNLDSFSKLFPEHVFDGKTLIGCGQSSHGSHEDYEIQKMVFEDLVVKHGCRIFIMEASYSTVLAVNKYVADGIGVRSEIMKSLGFIWVWDTQEVWELIEWTRNFNKGKAESEKVLFLGNDMQHLAGASNGVLHFLSSYNPTKLAEAKKLLDPFLSDSFLLFSKYSDEKINKYETIVKKVTEFVNETNYPLESPPSQDYILQKRNVIILEQTISIFKDRKRGYSHRDSMMAVNTKWIVDNKFRTGPVFLWAHNGHIQNSQIGDYKNMGSWLKDFYKEKYFTIGVDFIYGSVNAIKFSDKTDSTTTLAPPEPCKIALSDFSMNLEINKLLPGLLFLNLDEAKADTAFTNNWKNSAYAKIHTIGAGYNTSFPLNNYEALDVKTQYDALIFCRYSSPTIFLHSRNYAIKHGRV